MKDLLEKYRGNFGSTIENQPLEKPESKGSGQELVFDQLRNAILSGTLDPGHRLLQDEIAIELGLNRMAVREALLRLEVDNLVEFHPYKGFTVASFSLDDLREIYFLRGVLEGTAVQLAISHLGSEKLRELEQMCMGMEKCLETNDLNELARLNTAFHEKIYTAAQSPRLYKMIVRLWNGYPKSSLGYLTLRAPIMVKEHKAIYEALASLNPEEAQAKIKEHLNSALVDLMEYWSQRVGLQG